MTDIQSKIDQGLGWLRWATGAAFAILVPALVLEHMGYVSVPGDVIAWTYIAGIYWLTK